MANFYVRSAAAGTGTGASWANAKTTLAAACTAASAGDDIWVAADHAESQASAITIASPGTPASPCRIICAIHTGSSPPVSADVRTSATITTTGASNISLTGSFYIYGITFNAGSGNNSAWISFSTSSVAFYQKAENCTLNLVNTNTASRLWANGSLVQQALVEWRNVTVSFANASQGIKAYGQVNWINGALAAGAAIPTTLFVDLAGNAAGLVTLDGVDLSLAGSGVTLFGAQTSVTSQQLPRLINCKLGASVTIAATPPGRPNGPVTLQISDSGSAQYRSERYAYTGTLTTETTIVIGSGGATDGTTPITWKVVTTANPKVYDPFETFPYAEWCDTTGGALTRTFELVNDGTTLTNADIWAEVQYLGSSSYPIASIVSTGPADPLAAGSNLTTSSATWTTTGLASPTKQKIAVTFTPQMKGYFRIVFKFARASKTVYLNPRPNEI